MTKAMLSSLMPSIDSLPRVDKLRLMQHLASSLAAEEGPPAGPGEFPVWSPIQAHEAAARLLDYLKQEQKRR
jgi:hypothetical protein